MARILISSLGVGFTNKNDGKNEPLRRYNTAKYIFHGSEKIYDTPFVAAALAEHLQIERLYLVGTAKSMWEEVYFYFSEKSNKSIDEDYWTEISEKISFSKPGNPVLSSNDLLQVNKAVDDYLARINNYTTDGSRCFIIDYGLNQEELWRNLDVFMKIGQLLTADDKVYLDITHGFRSISFFNYLMLDLLKILQLKNDFQLGGLYYGMLDARRDLESDTAPIVDLSPMYNITRWAKGAYNFINFGNGYLLADLISDEKIAKRIRNISHIVNINYIDDFKREIDGLSSQLAAIESTDDPVVKYMEPFLRSFIDRFKGINSSGELQFSLAQWYFDNKRFAQGYICLAESIITKILEIYRQHNTGIGWGESNRRKIKNLIYDYQFYQKPEYEKIYHVYDAIRNKRNTIAHAGFSERQSFEDDINNANKYLIQVEKAVFNNSYLNSIPDIFLFNKLAF